MRIFNVLLQSIIFLSFSMVVHAEGISRGYFLGLKGSIITVDVPETGKTTFRVSDKTRVLSSSRILPLNRIPRNSIVKVVKRNGVAEVVIVEEMPK